VTWSRIDLTADELAAPSEPPIVCGVLYRGKRHAVSGPPEALKTVFSNILGLEHLRAGHGAFALIDFEMDARDVRCMLGELGATAAELENVHYFAPDGPPQQEDLDALVAAEVRLVVIDAAAGAYDVSGLDDNKRADAERFGQLWIKPLWRLGITTVLIDHVVKNEEARGRFAIGSERKLGAVDVHLGLHPVKHLTRGGRGIVRIQTHKDRPGHLARPTARELHLTSDPETNTITWEILPTDLEETAETSQSTFRPTVLMDRALDHVHAHLDEPLTRSALAAAIGGKRKYALDGIDLLIDEGRLALDLNRKVVPGYVPGTFRAGVRTHVPLSTEGTGTGYASKAAV
jgi:hypothetical protein